MASQNTILSENNLQALISLAKNYVPKTQVSLFQKYLRLQFASFSSVDFIEHSNEDLVSAAATQFKLLKKRTKNQTIVKVQNFKSNDNLQTIRSYVHVIMDDMPFIIDTIGMAINRNSYSIQSTINNRLKTTRSDKGLLSKVSENTSQKTKKNSEASIIMEFGPEFDEQKLKHLENDLVNALEDLSLAVADWQAMRSKMQDIINDFQTNPPPLKKEDIRESIAFLEWLLANHFTYLGYREYYIKENKAKELSLLNKKKTGLGILRDRGDRRDTSSAIHSDDLRKQIESRGLLIITKANSMATVHRDSHLDYIGIKQYDNEGNVVGEKRFLGLFTSVAYNSSPRYIPILRQKVERVIARSELEPSSHAGKALIHILETFPRDELFQSDIKKLLDTTTGLLQVQERKRVKIFMRRDAYRRFFAFTVYVPRDYYNTSVRETIESTLKDAVKGYKLESQVEISDSQLARVYLVVWSKHGRTISFKQKEYETKIRRAVRPWNDSVERQLEKRLPKAKTQRLMQRYKNAFPYAYIEDVSYYEASHDVERLAQLEDGQEEIALSLYRPIGFPESCIRFKIFRNEQSIPISSLVPSLENLGFRAISERPYQLKLEDEAIAWIQDIELVHHQGKDVDPANLREPFQEAFKALYSQQSENDILNQLVVDADLSWRQIVVLRAYTRYLRQTNLPYSMPYLMETLLSEPCYAKELFTLFDANFNPAYKSKDMQKLIHQSKRNLRTTLNNIRSIDKDRILRTYFDVINATLRTNFYQDNAQGNSKPYISFKLNPELIPELPLPKPKFEIWVYSPEVEGVHLRGGKVARGGLRWSDRPEDFRTEVLGLVKAQMVKNSVIVPVGAKGGFIVRNPITSSREEWFEQGRECYKTFLRGLLDITDNIKNGSIIPPQQVISKDEKDPYLVVAADKGTATFSDTANGIAAEYDFWLGDAFASGGSIGYDHKGMGITAKGAWESVKRHFFELGKDIQTEDFSVVGIGDMAGDVFGNGMLLSKHIQLKAAFNHLHIFIDPNPNSAKSFKERQRLFKLPRSSWEDYDTKLLSKGGGIYSRQAKEIIISSEAQNFLGTDTNKFKPNELINAILKTKVELLWNGGIGTYVKSSDESHVEVGDRANNELRVNGIELGAQVVGEGGNLGCTQKGRIEYALNGGRINTDFIDNSAGVDCSDHEVNIKILLNLVTQKKTLSLVKRNQLLASMTDEVESLVLKNNYLQSQAISLLESRASSRTREYMYVVDTLEETGRLNREIEFIPSQDIMQKRLKAKEYLTRPEIATIVSYAKMALNDALVKGKLVDTDYLNNKLTDYFPAPLQKNFSKLMPEHRLSREIIATELANEVVNRMGPAFILRVSKETDTNIDIACKAYVIARDIFQIESIWNLIKELDGKVSTDEQYRMYVQANNLIKYATRWLIERINIKTSIQNYIQQYSQGIKEIYTLLPRHIGKTQQFQYKSSKDHLANLGLNDRSTKKIISPTFLFSSLDIIEIAQNTKAEVKHTAQTYSKIGSLLDLYWLHNEVIGLKVSGQWQAMARYSLRDQAYQLHRDLTQKVLLDKRAQGDLSKWSELKARKLNAYTKMLKSIQTLNKRDFSSLSVLVQELRELL